MSSKCGFTTEENTKMIKMRLLAGMKDKALSRELQVDTIITLDVIKTRMRSKEITLNNQNCNKVIVLVLKTGQLLMLVAAVVCKAVGIVVVLVWQARAVVARLP